MATMEKAEKKEMLKQVQCDPMCGFMVRSHDEKELMEMAKDHAKRFHKMKMSDKEVREMMTNA